MIGKEFGSRRNSAAVGGGQFGDEGKGRIVDEFVSNYAQKTPVVVYRDNGGANAGHTVEFTDGRRVVLHQLPSGIFTENATVILGRGMVLHPGDLRTEIEQIRAAAGAKIAEIWIDEEAILSLDTHRAYEAVLKKFNGAGKGATGRGISPAYADFYLRQDLQVKDLINFDREKLKQHYEFYRRIIGGLAGVDLSEIKIPTLGKEDICVGSLEEFLSRLHAQGDFVASFGRNVIPFLEKSWTDSGIAFVFEKAQGAGLDPWLGTRPDITASRTLFSGIYDSTSGIVNPKDIRIRAGVVKATYMSSLGTRKLPSQMEEGLANQIRADANEYGGTTRRPRGIAYLDIPATRAMIEALGANCLVLTHMDIVYPETPVRVCSEYTIDNKPVNCYLNQTYLDQVRPKYIDFSPWDRQAIRQAKRKADLPVEARRFLDFLTEQIGLPILMITTGPKREQGITFNFQ